MSAAKVLDGRDDGFPLMQIRGSDPIWSSFGEAFAPSNTQSETEVLGQVQRTRSLFPRAELDRARAKFLSKKDEAYAVLARWDVDDRGRQQIRAYLDSFFDRRDAYDFGRYRDGQVMDFDEVVYQLKRWHDDYRDRVYWRGWDTNRWDNHHWSSAWNRRL